MGLDILSLARTMFSELNDVLVTLVLIALIIAEAMVLRYLFAQKPSGHSDGPPHDDENPWKAYEEEQTEDLFCVKFADEAEPDQRDERFFFGVLCDLKSNDKNESNEDEWHKLQALVRAIAVKIKNEADEADAQLWALFYQYILWKRENKDTESIGNLFAHFVKEWIYRFLNQPGTTTNLASFLWNGLPGESDAVKKKMQELSKINRLTLNGHVILLSDIEAALFERHPEELFGQFGINGRNWILAYWLFSKFSTRARHPNDFIATFKHFLLMRKKQSDETERTFRSEIVSSPLYWFVETLIKSKEGNDSIDAFRNLLSVVQSPIHAYWLYLIVTRFHKELCLVTFNSPEERECLKMQVLTCCIDEISVKYPYGMSVLVCLGEERGKERKELRGLAEDIIFRNCVLSDELSESEQQLLESFKTWQEHLGDNTRDNIMSNIGKVLWCSKGEACDRISRFAHQASHQCHFAGLAISCYLKSKDEEHYKYARDIIEKRYMNVMEQVSRHQRHKALNALRYCFDELRKRLPDWDSPTTRILSVYLRLINANQGISMEDAPTAKECCDICKELKGWSTFAVRRMVAEEVLNYEKVDKDVVDALMEVDAAPKAELRKKQEEFLRAVFVNK